MSGYYAKTTKANPLLILGEDRPSMSHTLTSYPTLATNCDESNDGEYWSMFHYYYTTRRVQMSMPAGHFKKSANQPQAHFASSDRRSPSAYPP